MAHWVPPECRDPYKRWGKYRMKQPNLLQLKEDIVVLLSNHNNGIPVDEFGQYFIEFLGYMVDPMDYGFNFWIDLLKTFGNRVIVKNCHGDFLVFLNRNGNAEGNHQPQSFTSVFPQELKNIFHKILLRHEKGLWASMLLPEFHKETGRNFNLRHWNMYSVRELVFNLPDVFYVVQCEGTGDCMLYNVEIPCQNDSSFMPRKVKIKILNVLSESRGGMLMPDFIRRYEEMYSEMLFPTRVGFDSMEHLLEMMRDSIEISFLDDGRIFLQVLPSARTASPREVFEIGSAMSTDGDPGTSQSQHDSDLRSTESLTRGPFLDEVTPPGHQIEKQTLPHEHDIRKYMAVYVSYIVNPGVFWFMLRGKSTSLALDLLMDDINDFYNSDGGELYIVPPDKLTNKQLLVARDPFDKAWYRAVVTATEGGTKQVEVHCIDYGSHLKVQPTDLRLLRNVYCDLPAQALEAELAFISPIQGHVWSTAATNRFKELAKSGTALMALIESRKFTAYSLCLCDTTSDADLHINDMLVAESHAKVLQKPVAMNFAMQPIVKERDMGIQIRSPSPVTLSDDDEDVILDHNKKIISIKDETISIGGSSSGDIQIVSQSGSIPFSTWF